MNRLTLCAFALILCAASLLPIAANAQGLGYVQPYTRSNGTYVPGYYRTNPNSNTYDNWSTKGNYNPYTGSTGTVDPYRTTYPSNNYYNTRQRNYYNNGY